MSIVKAQNAGINMDEGCLTNGTCSLDIYQTLGIRETADENSTEILVQDVVLGATFFIGTMATIGLLISGLMMIFGGANESTVQKGKQGLIYSLIGLLLVAFSYTIIRFFQYIAQGQV